MPRSHRRNSLRRLQAYLPKVLAALAGVAVLAGGGYLALRKTPDDHFQAGAALFREGDLKGAAIELKNTLQAAPDQAEARYLLGRIHFASGDYASAEKELKKARDLGVKDIELQALRARALLALNEPQRVLEEVMPEADAPATARAALHALRARAHLMLRDDAAADQELRSAQSLAADHPETLVSLAYQALARNQAEQALAFSERAVAQADQRADLWTMRGDLLRLAKRPQDALAAYAKALALEPANIPARLATAQLHLEANLLDQAEVELKELLKHAPANVLGRYLQAFIDFRRANIQEAHTKLQDVLRAAPNFLPAHLLAGATSLASGNREAAKSHLNKVLEAAPNHALARKLMAATLSGLGEVGEAQKILGSFGEAGGDPLLNTLRGEVALRKGDYAAARKHLEAMGDAAPQSPQYFTELAASRMGSGDEAGAIQALTQAAELDTASARPDVLLVLAHLKEKRYDAAFKVVDKLEKERPDDPLIQNLRGTIHIAREDKTQARASFTKALQLKPGYFPAASNLALLDMMEQNAKAARARFEQLLKHAPQESRAWLALAALDAREKNEAGYLKHLEQAKKANNKHAEAHLLLARYWLGKQDGGKALAAAQEGQSATGRPEFHELVGLAQLLQKDQASALSTFTRWAEVSPGNPMAHFRLAQVQGAGKNHEAALKSLDKALALRADFSEAMLSKALLLGQTGRAAEGLKLARALQARAPKNAAGFLAEAEIQLGEKKPLDAARMFAKAAEISGQGLLLDRAYRAYAAANQAAEGEKRLQQWLQTKPNDTAVRHVLALAQLNAGRLKEAAEHYRALIRANARDLVALNNLAWILGELRDPQALAIAEQAHKLAPNNASVLDTYGWQLTQAGQGARGLPYLREALKAQPDNPEIRWHLAVALEKTGDPRGALQELDKLLASRLDFPQKSEARAAFERLRATAK